jgi:hypothetical protein
LSCADDRYFYPEKGCPEGNKKGVAMVYENEWAGLLNRSEKIRQQVKERSCFFCQWARVNFMSLSSASISNKPVVNRLNAFRVKLEERGEFCADDVLANQLIYGAFPRFNMYCMHPALMLVYNDPAGPEPIVKVIEERDGIEEAHTSLVKELTAIGESTSFEFSVVPAFFPSWQGFHSRGRLTSTEVPRSIRPQLRILESCSGPEWDPLSLQGNSLPLLTKNLVSSDNVNETDKDIARIINYLSHSFEERRKISMETGYPLSNFDDSLVIQNCVVICPKAAVIKFNPASPEQYAEVFRTACSSALGDIQVHHLLPHLFFIL